MIFLVSYELYIFHLVIIVINFIYTFSNIYILPLLYTRRVLLICPKYFLNISKYMNQTHHFFESEMPTIVPEM